MPFIQRIIGWIVGPILSWLVTKVGAALKNYLAQKQAQKEIEDANRIVREQTEKAVTPEERKHAAEDVIRRF